MRPLWKDILAAIWLGMVVPGIVLNAFVLKERHRTAPNIQNQQQQIQQPSGRMIPVRDPEGTRLYMDLEDYLTGVVLAEMPSAFHKEALKAQSVAARTYTWKAYTTGGKHWDGSVCMDSACCQAYLSEADYYQHGGTAESLDKVRQAVLSTSDMVVLYNGALIEATYFSSSGGSTEAAIAVWGGEIPYLQAVSSPEDTIKNTCTFSASEFQRLLEKEFAGSPATWFDYITYTAGGGVEEIGICGEIYTGTELRSLLGLRSTDFVVEPRGQMILITTYGYGHRVGMSQHGANTMAESGYSWQQILQHYYPGTTVSPIS